MGVLLLVLDVIVRIIGSVVLLAGVLLLIVLVVDLADPTDGPW